MKATTVIKLLKKYGKCPACHSDIFEHEIKIYTFNLRCHECGWKIEGNKEVAELLTKEEK